MRPQGWLAAIARSIPEGVALRAFAQRRRPEGPIDRRRPQTSRVTAAPDKGILLAYDPLQNARASTLSPTGSASVQAVNLRRLSPSDLQRLEPGAFGQASLVAIVPLTDDVQWAVDRTWEVARAAAARGRRVALVDLSLDRPCLDRGMSGHLQEGIVDAFLYGVSLGRVAQPQEPKGLHFIGVGTRAADPSEIWANPRWARLTQGFAKEGALLLAFIPVNGIPAVAFEPEAVVLLAQEGFDPYEHPFPDLDRWLPARGPVLVVEETTAPEPARQAPAPARPQAPQQAETPRSESSPGRPIALEPPLAGTGEPDFSGPPASPAHPPPSPRNRIGPRPPQREARRRRSRGNRRFYLGAVVVFVVVIGAMFGWPELRTRVAALAGSDAEPAADSMLAAPPLGAAVLDTASDSVADTTGTSRASPGEAIPPPRLDSLFYGVQVAAFNSYDRAMTHALEVGNGLLAPAVTPVRIGGDRLWYRVIVGAFASSAEADSALREFWNRGRVERGQGTVIRTPQAFDLGLRPTADSATAEAMGLRRRGLPAYVLRAPGGARVLVGAFQRPAQAAAAESLLTTAGITASLVQRMGIRQ